MWQAALILAGLAGVQREPLAVATPTPAPTTCATCARLIDLQIDNRTGAGIMSAFSARGSRTRTGAVRGAPAVAIDARQSGRLSIRALPDDPDQPCRATLVIALSDGRTAIVRGYDICAAGPVVLTAADIRPAAPPLTPRASPAPPPPRP